MAAGDSAGCLATCSRPPRGGRAGYCTGRGRLMFTCLVCRTYGSQNFHNCQDPDLSLRRTIHTLVALQEAKVISKGGFANPRRGGRWIVARLTRASPRYRSIDAAHLLGSSTPSCAYVRSRASDGRSSCASSAFAAATAAASCVHEALTTLAVDRVIQVTRALLRLVLARFAPADAI